MVSRLTGVNILGAFVAPFCRSDIRNRMFDIFDKIESERSKDNTGDNSLVNKYKKENKGKDLTREWTYKEVWDEVLYSGNVIPKTLTEAHRVVVVDADGICYRTSAACETRSVRSNVGGIEVEFPTRTLLKEYCVDVDVDYKDLVVTDHHVNEPISNCLSTLKKTVSNLYKELDATHVVFLLGGSGNFRLDLPLPSQYKSQRKVLRRPDYLKDCREYLNKYYDTFIIQGTEADDINEALSAHIVNKTNAWGCAVSMDKDILGCIEKNRYFHLVNRTLHEMKGGLGYLELVKGKLKGEGLMFSVAQTLLFDRGDNYFMNSHYLRRYGEVSFYNDFHNYKTEKSFLEAVLIKLDELLPEKTEYVDWQGVVRSFTRLGLVELYFSCAYMRMSPDDDTTFKSLLDRYGVEYAESIPLITADNKEVISD